MTTPPLASRSAAPSTLSDQQLIHLHGEASNACAMAVYYTRKGNHAGAARKAVQALSALRKLAANARGAA